MNKSIFQNSAGDLLLAVCYSVVRPWRLRQCTAQCFHRTCCQGSSQRALLPRMDSEFSSKHKAWATQNDAALFSCCNIQLGKTQASLTSPMANLMKLLLLAAISNLARLRLGSRTLPMANLSILLRRRAGPGCCDQRAFIFFSSKSRFKLVSELGHRRIDVVPVSPAVPNLASLRVA